MHPHPPAAVQHGNPSGKQKFLHDVRLHDPVFKSGGMGPEGMAGAELPPLDPVLGSLVIVLATQFPKLQRAFVIVQLVQALPPCPHALSSIPILQTPLSQQPAGQVVVLQGKGAPGPLATVASSPLPLVPPLELLPVALLLGLAPLLPLPEPPASCGATRPPSSASRRRLSGSPPAPPPVAHATAMNPPPSKSAPSAAQRLPIILRLLPTLAGATRVR